jgi:alpha-D-ribose 1-methylphosphonate 5-triphosphate synthase subunit PhnI
MTNEEYTEEIYYEAHSQGFIGELRAEIDRLKASIDHYKLPHHDLVQKAYYSVKSINQNNEVFISNEQSV